MKKIHVLGLLVLAACGGAPVAVGGPSSGGGGGGGGGIGNVTIKNDSSYDIDSIQLTPHDSVSWGANLLGDDVLMKGESQKIAVFDCKKYDLKLIDHEKDECTIQDIDLCFEDKAWEITDTVLAICATEFGAH